VGPTGLFFAPFGETALEEGIAIFSEQVRALSSAGVDLLVIETQIDLQEARLALLAAKEACSLPVIVSMTFDEHGQTLTGSDPLTCLNVLQSLGAAAFGVNCSTGPELMLARVREIAPYARIPLVVKANAGLPQVVDGRTVFPMTAEAFSRFTPDFAAAGVRVLGGCCGTTPEHIRLLRGQLQRLQPAPPVPAKRALLLSSPRRTLEIAADPPTPLRLVGERINPTGKTDLQEDLRAGRMERVKTLALRQQEDGADVLDVNLGVPGADERELMQRAVAELALLTPLPLCLDSSSPEVIESALRLYPGRALVNSLTGERAKLERLLPILRAYGAAFIVLPLDDGGIPETFEQRRAILERIRERCTGLGIRPEDMVVDGLALTASANPAQAAVTLETLRYAARELKAATVLGVSNISFGLPARPVLNRAFLAMAAAQGLNCVIADPGDAGLQDMRLAVDVLTGRDPASRAYLERFAGRPPDAAAGRRDAPAAEATLREIVLQGGKDRIEAALQQALERNPDPLALLEQQLFPAIQEVGEKYQRREFFLPQLVAAAETMERGVRWLSPRLSHDAGERKGTVVLATVLGDIHDIGKKIVGLMLKNNGYTVVDLGKSVDAETIVERAREHQADVIGLSALMTTTMSEMPKVLQRVRRELPRVKVILGGAVVTQKYADEIAADGYAADSVQAVALVESLLHAGGPHPRKGRRLDAAS